MPAQSPLKRTSGESLQPGLVRQQLGRLHEAEAGYREILEREQRHPDALHLLGVIAQQQGQYQTAIERISNAIQSNPNAPDFHNNLGNTYRLQGNDSAAIASYRAALALDTDHVDALHCFANSLGEQDQFAEAESFFATGCPRVQVPDPTHRSLSSLPHGNSFSQ